MATAREQVMDSSIVRLVSRNTDMMLSAGIILILAMMIVPLPAFILDLLLATNFTMAVVILMVAMYVTHPLELSVFPGLLLIITIFRLSLNVASTRLILGEGYAGEVISAFGSFVVKGNYVVGFIIFIILVIIQFIVIVKGAGRIAEVSARFTLDAMPGKQMAIDADMNAGLITEHEARERRATIAREAEFYGAMDGASKFVKGDAIAGLLINIVNLIGGFIIGVVQKGLTISDSLQNYSLLTVGDGLVSQIPALIISTAAGMLVTRNASGLPLDQELRGQLLSSPKGLMIVSGALTMFAIVPGLPTIPFLALATVTGGIGYLKSKEKSKPQPKPAAEKAAPPKQEQIEDYLQVDPLELEIGYGLISLVDESQGGDLFGRITNMRKQLAMELGIIIPPVRVRDNLQLEPDQYVIKIKGNIVATDELVMGRYLAMSPSGGEIAMEGIPVREPAFGLPAVWVSERDRENAEIAGYTVVEPAAVLTTFLQQILRRNADKILGRQETKKLIENLKKDYPAIVEELAPDVLPIGSIQKVLQNLLRENVPIRDLVTILESLMDYARVTKNVDVLTEYVRHSLSQTIARMYQDASGTLHAIAMDPGLEQTLINALQNQRDPGPSLGLSPAIIESINESMKASVDTAVIAGLHPVVLCAATVRPYFYRLIHTSFPSVTVLSFTELPPESEIEFIGTLEVTS